MVWQQHRKHQSKIQFTIFKFIILHFSFVYIFFLQIIIVFTCFELAPKTWSKVNFLVCLSSGLSFMTTSLFVGTSTTVDDLPLFSLVLGGLEKMTKNDNWFYFYLFFINLLFSLKKEQISRIVQRTVGAKNCKPLTSLEQTLEYADSSPFCHANHSNNSSRLCSRIIWVQIERKLSWKYLAG